MLEYLSGDPGDETSFDPMAAGDESAVSTEDDLEGLASALSDQELHRWWGER